MIYTKKGIDFTVKMFDLLFLYICRKVEDKKTPSTWNTTA